MGFPHGSVSKESACNAGHPDSIPELGKTEQNRWVREMSQPRRGRSGSETLASVTGQHPEVGGPQGGGSYSKCEDLEALSMISLDHAPTEGVAV